MADPTPVNPTPHPQQSPLPPPSEPFEVAQARQKEKEKAAAESAKDGKTIAPLTAEQLVKRRKDAFVLAQTQAKERADLAKKQADARKAAKDEPVRAKLVIDQKEERRVLAEKHGEAQLKVDPTGRVVFSGLDMAGKVSELAADLAGPAADLDFVVAEPTEFGLDLEVFDPMSGIVITAAQGARRNVGQPAILLTADQVVAEVVAARTHQQSALQ